MIPLCNLHTHTCYCDGQSTPDRMAEGAFARGFSAYGFSGHAPTVINGMELSWAMTKQAEEEYFAVISAVKEQYRGKMAILLGCELDLFSDKPTLPYDYTIGSVHFVKKDGEFIEVDSNPASVYETVTRFYGEDISLYAEDFFRTASEVVKVTDCDIIGHIDLITKGIERVDAFRECFTPENPRYRRAALDAIDALLPYDRIFEINTGAMSRGYRSAPYPAPFILEYLASHGARLMITGDSHSLDAIDYAYDKALDLARSCGVKTLWTVNTNGEFVEVKI